MLFRPSEASKAQRSQPLEGGESDTWKLFKYLSPKWPSCREPLCKEVYSQWSFLYKDL